MACCVLHNLMRVRRPSEQNNIVDREDTETCEVVPGAWRQEPDNLVGLEALRGNTTTKTAKEQREYLKEYYNSEVGRVPWQDKMIT